MNMSNLERRRTLKSQGSRRRSGNPSERTRRNPGEPSRPNRPIRRSDIDRRRMRRIRERRRRAQRRRRRFFLALLILVLVLTIKSFMNLNQKDSTLQEVAIHSSDSGDIVRPENEGSVNKDEPIFGTYIKENWKHNLEIVAKTNPNAKIIVDRFNDLDDSMIKLAGNNFDAIDFVAKSVDSSAKNTFNYSEELTGTKYPYFLQWDERWGYNQYATGIIGYTGCAPTVMATAITGLTGQRHTPDEIAKISEDNGFSNNSGTSWDLYPFLAEKYDLKITQLKKDENQINHELNLGHPIIISVNKGQFTQYGHVMLILGLDNEGKYILNDPNNVQNTQKRWTYEEIQGDLKSIWTISNPKTES